MNKQQWAMLEFWRKAYREGEAEVELPTEAMATTARFALYNVAKAVKRDHDGKFEQELHDAVAEVSIKKVGNRILAQNIGKTEVTEAFLGVVGEVKSDTEREMAAAKESEERMKRLLAEAGADPGVSERAKGYLGK